MITFYNISFLMLFFFDLTMLYQVKKLDLYEGMFIFLFYYNMVLVNILSDYNINMI